MSRTIIGGNVVGYNPYQVGKPSCATYGLRSSSRYQGLCAPSVAPVVSANAIDTYEYKQNSNNKKYAYSTQSATATTSSSSSSPSVYSSSKQAANAFSQRKTTTTTSNSAFSATLHKATSTTTTTTASRRTQLRPRAVQKHTILRTYLSNPNLSEHQLQQQAQNNKNKNSNTDVGVAAEVYVFDESKQNQQVTHTTPQPAKRGWSLLTWRG
ncbi:unnamed protein product [Ceratitis capitata]|uniref:(Mediterranean fruit fly) hypothetical protein n=1 Tax=Ceratitis capitata TaxID=7213 RepID=A0A811U8T3_CERCA|nr:unnamed protein product [Ceratitis capitata]